LSDEKGVDGLSEAAWSELELLAKHGGLYLSRSARGLRETHDELKARGLVTVVDHGDKGVDVELTTKGRAVVGARRAMSYSAQRFAKDGVPLKAFFGGAPQGGDEDPRGARRLLSGGLYDGYIVTVWEFSKTGALEAVGEKGDVRVVMEATRLVPMSFIVSEVVRKVDQEIRLRGSAWAAMAPEREGELLSHRMLGAFGERQPDGCMHIHSGLWGELIRQVAAVEDKALALERKARALDTMAAHGLGLRPMGAGEAGISAQAPYVWGCSGPDGVLIAYDADPVKAVEKANLTKEAGEDAPGTE
jgi:hypothetical protein